MTSKPLIHEQVKKLVAGEQMTTNQKAAYQEPATDSRQLAKGQGGIHHWPRKGTYYKPDGEALPNLPMDDYSRARYLERGLLLHPPMAPVSTQGSGVGSGSGVEAEKGDLYSCDECPFITQDGGEFTSHLITNHG